MFSLLEHPVTNKTANNRAIQYVLCFMVEDLVGFDIQRSADR